MIKITRLYVENFKLFDKKEITFGSAPLFVLDGPNGYGKTTVFDAIELIISGKLKCVTESESIDGKQGYQTVFFAKNNNKVVIIKAEFEDKRDGNHTLFALGLKVDPTILQKAEANPKKIFERMDFYDLPEYECPVDEWEAYKITASQVKDVRTRRFGGLCVDYFGLIHYVHQEDRLSYFKQSETARSLNIEFLLGVENERTLQKQAEKKAKELKKAIDEYEKQIAQKSNNLNASEQGSEESVEYENLLEVPRPWDEREILFSSDSEQKYYAEIDEIETYIKYKEIYELYAAYEGYLKIPENKRLDSVKAWVMKSTQSISLDELEKLYRKHIFLEKEYQLIESKEYLSVEFEKIYAAIDIDYSDDMENLVLALKKSYANQGKQQKALNNVIEIRRSIRTDWNESAQSGQCPYCGYAWENQGVLDAQFVQTEDIIKNLLAEEGEQYQRYINDITEKINTEINNALLEEIHTLQNNKFLCIYESLGSRNDFVIQITYIDALMKNMKVVLDERYDWNDIDGTSQKLLNKIELIGNSFSEDFLVVNSRYDFSSIKAKYQLTESAVGRLNPELIERKRKYIQKQAYLSFVAASNELDVMRDKLSNLKEIYKQIKSYSRALDNAIQRYKEQIIKAIEIPFFLYSSRILQSYQGGQGIIMKATKDQIRFCSPESEHDIIYTLSSGQLSAVLLAFSLALNKIYAQNGLKAMFIDDPIQCIDDINMVSFVDLIRSEFSDCQIILSTHEDDFSNYIRYKYKKSGLEAQRIALKDYGND